MKLTKLLAIATVAGGCSAAVAAPAIEFLIDGDTFNKPFLITNLSTDGEQITSFSLTLNTGFVFDTTGDTSNQGRYSFLSTNKFSPVAGSQAPADGGSSLTYLFGNAFIPSCPATSPTSCEFGWVVDVDGTGAIQDVVVLGSQLIGATVSATFSDGSSASGMLGACPTGRCSSEGAYWQASGSLPPTNPMPEPGSLALAGLALLAAGAVRARKA